MNSVLELTKEGNPGSRWTKAGIGNAALSQSKTTSAALADPPIPIRTRLWNEDLASFTETRGSFRGPRKVSGNRSTAPSMLERSIFESCFTSSKSTGIYGPPRGNHSRDWLISYGLGRVPSMMEVPRRAQRLSVALPASFTKDVPHLREKTSRVGLIARSLAIFRVDEAVIYNDEIGKGLEIEGRLFEKLLAYQETPQYLRKALFKQDPDLQFSGILPPLRMPSHPNVAEPRIGEIREGLVIESGASSMVNAGFRATVQVPSKLTLLERVTIRLVRISPQLQGEPVEPTRLPIYWGFRVTRTNLTLGRLIRSRSQDLTISTSRRGKVARDVLNDLTVQWKSSQRPMVVFGSPSEGIPEILAKEGADLGRMVDFNLNMIANQGVETVRTEEAVLATMSILNLLEET